MGEILRYNAVLKILETTNCYHKIITSTLTIALRNALICNFSHSWNSHLSKIRDWFKSSAHLISVQPKCKPLNLISDFCKYCHFVLFSPVGILQAIIMNRYYGYALLWRSGHYKYPAGPGVLIIKTELDLPSLRKPLNWSSSHLLLYKYESDYWIQFYQCKVMCLFCIGTSTSLL